MYKKANTQTSGGQRKPWLESVIRDAQTLCLSANGGEEFSTVRNGGRTALN